MHVAENTTLHKYDSDDIVIVLRRGLHRNTKATFHGQQYYSKTTIIITIV